jgi:hypothetical protein
VAKSIGTNSYSAPTSSRQTSTLATLVAMADPNTFIPISLSLSLYVDKRLCNCVLKKNQMAYFYSTLELTVDFPPANSRRLHIIRKKVDVFRK